MTMAISTGTARASSIDIIWQVSGTSHMVVTSESDILAADIVMTIGPADAGIGGAGAEIELSADYGPNLSGVVGEMHTLPGWLPTFPESDGGASHLENIIAEVDLFGTGATLPPGSVTYLGAITVQVGAKPPGNVHTVMVSASGPEDDIIASSVTGSILSQFTFGAGTISRIPEPMTASLLALGLVGLATVRRRRIL